MKITFVLPMFLERPAGGFKVVYEYANRLHSRGHRISIVHPRNLAAGSGPVEAVKSRLWRVKHALRHGRPVPWFDLDPEIESLMTPDLEETFVPDADAIVATAFQTALPVSRYSASKGRKFYLIQSWETWHGGQDDVSATWRLPLEKIVISKWLMRKAGELGVEAHYIPIGLDFTRFFVARPIRERATPRIAMLANPSPIKGTADGLIAIEMARREFRQLRAVLFGVHPRDGSIPDWIEYLHDPTPEQHRELLNESTIFVHPSLVEGWGLPPAEAMACGCALISTSNEGVFEFAEDGVNALISPVSDPLALGKNLISLLRDDDRRIALAEAGHAAIQRFAWDSSVEKLERLLAAAPVG